MKPKWVSKVDNVHLILSGGGSKGAYQWGALKYLNEIGITPNRIYGASAGALNACLVSGRNYHVGDRVWYRLSNEKIYRGNPYLRFMTLQSSLYDSTPLHELIEDTLSRIDLQIPFEVVAVQLEDGKAYTFPNDHEHFREALLASTAVPILFQPIKINGSLWIDGGVREMTPTKWSIQHDPDLIISVTTGKTEYDLSRIAGESPDGLNALDVMKSFLPYSIHEMFRQDFDQFKHINNTLQQIRKQGSDFVYRNHKTGEPYEYYNFLEVQPNDVEFGGSFSFDRHKIPELISVGYEQCKKQVEQFNFDLKT